MEAVKRDGDREAEAADDEDALGEKEEEAGGCIASSAELSPVSAEPPVMCVGAVAASVCASNVARYFRTIASPSSCRLRALIADAADREEEP